MVKRRITKERVSTVEDEARATDTSRKERWQWRLRREFGRSTADGTWARDTSRLTKSDATCEQGQSATVNLDTEGSGIDLQQTDLRSQGIRNPHPFD